MAEVIMEADLLEAILQALQDHLGLEVKINDVQILSEPDRRNRIARLFLSTNNCDRRSVIFKHSLSDKTQETTDEDILARFARDFAGLKFLGRSDINHSIPKFLGASQSFRFILLEDLGNNRISLVDSLTKSDPGKAIAALKRFTKSLGHFHMASYERLGEYDELLVSAHPRRETLEDRIKWNEEDLIPKLELVCNSFDIPFTNEIKQEANLARPRFISRLQAFIQVSKEHNMLPHLRKSAEQMLAHAYEKWDDARPLDLYPAFQN